MNFHKSFILFISICLCICVYIVAAGIKGNVNWYASVGSHKITMNHLLRHIPVTTNITEDMITHNISLDDKQSFG